MVIHHKKVLIISWITNYLLPTQGLINEVVPDMDLNYEFISEETGERRDMLLPMGVTFFWPQS